MKAVTAAAALLALCAGCDQHEPAPFAAPPPPRHPAPPPGPPTKLILDVRDEAGRPLPARVLLRAGDGKPVRFGSLDLYDNRQSRTACDFVPGVLGTWDGIVLAYGSGEIRVVAADCGIPPGRYHVSAWHGIEYERWEGEVDLSVGRGRVPLQITLERAWAPAGTLAADLHVHAEASDDSLVPNPQRVVAEVAAGILVIGLSDHNVNGDLGDDIHDLHLENTAVAIASDERTADAVHLGVYPVTVVKDRPYGGAPHFERMEHATVAQMFHYVHELPGNPIVQVNHPCFRVTALFDGTKWDGVGWPPPFPLAFDAVEVLNGYSAANAPGDRRIDECVRAYYTLVDHGHPVAPMGNSDVHNLNWLHDGVTRTYVLADDPRVHPFDEAGFVAAIRARRVVATSGPWLDVAVAPYRGGAAVGPGQALVPSNGSVWVDVTVAQARFVHVDELRISVGGRDAIRIAVPADRRAFRWTGAVVVGNRDTWLGIDAGGDAPLPADQTGNYQQDKWGRPGVTPFAIAGPILIDADGNRRWQRGDADLALPDHLATPLGSNSHSRPGPPIRPPSSDASASSPQ